MMNSAVEGKVHLNPFLHHLFLAYQAHPQIAETGIYPTGQSSNEMQHDRQNDLDQILDYFLRAS